jgi:hypothetical protein
MAVYTFQPDDTTGVDVSMFSVAPTVNQDSGGNQGYLYVGENPGAGSSYAHSLYKVDFLSKVPASFIPTACTFTFKAASAPVSRTLQMYRVKRAWVENQATWNVYSTGNNWQTAGCEGANDREATPIGSQAFANSGSPITVTVTLDAAGLSLVKEMINGTFANNGFLLHFDTEVNDWVAFYSSYDSTAGNRPLCTLTGNSGSGGIIFI